MSTILSRVQEYPRSLLFVLALGLVLRTLFISLHERPLISDEKEYARLAYNLASKATYTYDESPTAYRPVGYPAFVGLVYLVFGHHPLAVKFLQALIDIATSLLIYLLLTSYPERTRVLGAALWAFYVPAILYTNFLMSETIFTFLLVVSALLLTRASNNKIQTHFLLGILLGVLTLMKPSILIVLIVLPLFYHRFGLSFRKMYPLALTVLLVLAPWLIRNYATFGTFSLASNGGVNLLIGNNPNGTGAYGITFDPAIVQDSKDEFEVNEKAFRYAVGYIVDNPGTFIINGVKKLAHLFESEGGILVWTFHQNPGDPSTRYALKYRSLPLYLILLTNLPYFAIVISGVFGFLCAKKEKLWWISTIVLMSWMGVHAVFFGGGRFHLPLIPLMAVFAAQFLGDVRGSLSSLSGNQKLAGIGATLLLSALWVYEGIAIYNV